MTGQISISKISFIGALNRLNTASDKYTLSTAHFPEYSSSSISIDHYKENFDALVKAVTLYQGLLQTDIQMLQEAGDILESTDATNMSMFLR